MIKKQLLALLPMTPISDAEPPDGGGSSDEDFRYESSFMDTDELNLIIKKVPFSGRKGHCSKSLQNAHVVQLRKN